MQWHIIALNYLYAALGLVLMFFAYKVFDWLSPRRASVLIVLGLPMSHERRRE
jgi:hypothetical protein